MARILFSQQANGSLIVLDGQVRGSALIGQSFADPLLGADPLPRLPSLQ